MHKSARLAVGIFSLISVICAGCSETPGTRTLELVVVDGNEAEVPCRILVRPLGGECLLPGGATEVAIGPDRWFMAAGRVRLSVPAGEVEIRVERGLEYMPFRETVVMSGSGSVKTVRLQRWVNMKQRGYLSGENHLHVDSVQLAPMLAAEGLDFGTSMTWHNGPGNDWCLPVPPGTGNTRMLEFGGRTIPTTVFDGEIEYRWGAIYFLNLPDTIPIPGDPKRPNLDYVKHIVGAGGYVHYQGGWSREVLVDALLGYVHAVNVCNNNFHRHRFQPRSRYSNLLEVEGFPVYPDTDEGMMRMNTDTYYRLLNCGLRLPAGAGSATGFKEVPVGYNRAYVRLDAGATVQDFYRVWAEGKNFVSNGPMLFMESSDSQKPGDQISFPADGGKVLIRLRAIFSEPLTSLELIVNGEVMTSIETQDQKEVSAEVEVKLDRGSWIAARCTARDGLLTDEELAVYANEDRQQPSRLRYAHTSPIYVTVGGKGAVLRESVEEAFRMLDRFEDFTRESASPEYVKPTLEAVAEARRVLRSKLGAGG